ncbi:hypothetical protein A3Q56_01278 [Intoshia linei]|uniref:adenylate cyclase n=1 Tax=Intoshia linei TaxID=1819745 RepID=A0A177B9G6_9BILA|nr:hypothetical protein A3Q56_01278 [Intoshia linei]
MAASGLNKNELPSNNDIEHLCTLMDFAFEIKKLTDKFNLELFNFQFKIKIGYNVGNVVAGVIGTKKLHYDIWGDAVNLASRMYTSAQNNQIQVFVFLNF